MLRAGLTTIALLSLCTGLASAAPNKLDPSDTFTTTLLSAGPDGAAANAPVQHVVISRDNRVAQVTAFDTAASNLVAGDSNGVSDIFTVTRQPVSATNGVPWVPGAMKLITKAYTGGPANGPSTMPALAGDSRNQPKCIAFLSSASNLVPGDTNGKPDAFVADLTTGKITRVSVDSNGKQSSGTTYAVSVDGRCRRVAFISDDPSLGSAKVSASKRPSAAAMQLKRRAPAGSREVYARGIGGTTLIDTSLKGVTWTVTRSYLGNPANGVSGQLQLSENENAVVYDTTSSNLVNGSDANHSADVYESLLTRKYLPRVGGHRPQAVSITTRLISANAAGHGANGSSFHPALNNDGSRVAYTTTAPELAAGASSSVTQVVLADPTKSPISQTLASAVNHSETPGNASSDNASLTDAGTWVNYDTAATNIEKDAVLGTPVVAPHSVMLFMINGRQQEQINSNGDEQTLPGASTAGMTSPHGNYIVFLNSGQAWMRYLGPK